MYLHIGQNKTIKTNSIIGVFDLDATSVKKKTRDYLYLAEKQNNIENVSDDLPKSFIVLENKKIIISTISSSTLIKRSYNDLYRKENTDGIKKTKMSLL